MPSSSVLPSPSRRSQHSPARSKLRSPAHRGDVMSNKVATPNTIQYLDQLSFEMVASKLSSKSKDVRYVLLVEKRLSDSRWSVSRSYRDYRALQKRLLDIMQQGHFCNAECPWMYSFVQSQFPKEGHFFSSSSYVVNKRRDAFAKCFATLHAHLLNRDNHCCSVVTNAVAMELIDFINEDLPGDCEHRWSHFATASTSALRLSECSVAGLPTLEISVRCNNQTGFSDASAASSTSTSSGASYSSECSLCSASPGMNSLPAADDANPQDRSSDCESGACFSFTTLSCGHQFHDECIISKLNESLHCPTCGHAQVYM